MVAALTAIRVLIVDDDPLVRGALTPRERDVAIAIAHGGSNADIADKLVMSVTTVKAHMSHILTKLDLTNRTQLALLVHDANLI